MKKLTIPLWVIGAGAILLWWWAGWNARVAQKDAEAVQGAKQALALAAPFHRQIAHLQQTSHNAQQRAQVALSRAEALGTSIGRLRQALDQATTRDSVPMVPHALADRALREAELRDSLRVVAIGNLETAVRAERQRADLAEARIQALETQLRNVLQVADCRLLGLGFAPRCPSRNASLLLGVGVGATAVLISR